MLRRSHLFLGITSTLGSKCLLLKETNTPTRPRIEPGSPDPESDALTGEWADTNDLREKLLQEKTNWHLFHKTSFSRLSCRFWWGRVWGGSRGHFFTILYPLPTQFFSETFTKKTQTVFYRLSSMKQSICHFKALLKLLHCCVIRKPTFCICENKDADQLRSNREADQRLCFRCIDSKIPLLSKSEISSI